jgi:hypothetical protein
MTRLGHRCGIMLLCKRLARALVVGIREDGALAAMPWPLGATHRHAALCPARLTYLAACLHTDPGDPSQ